jgi:citrate lyase subunit beta/citryl-CoA lyase
MDETRRRSALSVPGGDERKLAKAIGLSVDEIVIDLEDSVPPSTKDAARAEVAAWLVGAGDVGPAVAVRVNAVGSPWCHTDIEACVRAGGPLRSIVVPKVESAGDVAFVTRLLDGVEAAAGSARPIGVQALIETAAGLANVVEIARASDRVCGLILGYADLGASLGIAPNALDLWLPAQHAVLVAARAAGVHATDGPHLGIAVDDGLRAAVDRAAALGFDGKWVIHPGQLDTVNTAFQPGADRVEWARRVLAALREGHADGVGAIAVDGQMIDEAVAVAARRVLAQAGAR